MPELREADLVDAWILREATFREAAVALAAAGLPAIAVLDGDRRVLGVFSEHHVLGGLFPRYLSEMRHTAFAHDVETSLNEQAARTSGEPVVRFAERAEPLRLHERMTHAAERFLHSPFGALPVVDERRRFVGMLTQAAFARATVERAFPEAKR